MPKTTPQPDATPQAPSTLQTLPLNKLLLSNLNVRQTERDADIAALAEDIAARGLKQNLVVVPAHFTTSTVDEPWEGEDRWADKFEVIAGGRRFQAMSLLVANGRLPADHPVPVMVEPRESARETSLSENLHKVSMNPADEFEAFNAIVEQQMAIQLTEGAAIEYCAKRFGVTPRHVAGRLRLAALAAPILAALRQGEIALDKAMAYAGTADQDLQEKVFADAKKYAWWTAKDIRTNLRGRTVPLDDPLAQFVGLITYQAAGGRIEAEMFMGTDDEQRLVDVPLLEKLARQIAEEAIPALAKADGVKQGLYAPGIGHAARWPGAPKGFTKAWDYGDDVKKADLKKSVGVYALQWVDIEDSEDQVIRLARVGRFKPEEKQPAREERDWEAERAADAREREIRTKAARMALPSVAGTELEGRIFYPNWGRKVEDGDQDEANSYVVVWVQVPNSAIDANREEATRRIDEEIAAAEAERIAKLAEDFPDHVKPITDKDEDEDDGTDELVTDEAED